MPVYPSFTQGAPIGYDVPPKERGLSSSECKCGYMSVSIVLVYCDIAVSCRCCCSSLRERLNDAVPAAAIYLTKRHDAIKGTARGFAPMAWTSDLFVPDYQR